VWVLETGEDKIPPLLQIGAIASSSCPRVLCCREDASGEPSGGLPSELIDVVEVRGVWPLKAERMGEVEYTLREWKGITDGLRMERNSSRVSAGRGPGERGVAGEDLGDGSSIV